MGCETKKILHLALLVSLSPAASAGTVVFSQDPIEGTGTLYQSSWNDGGWDKYVYEDFTLTTTGDIAEIRLRGGRDLTIAMLGFLFLGANPPVLGAGCLAIAG